MTAPKDKSAMTIAERTHKILRINQENPLHALAPLTDKNPAKYVGGGIVVNPKRPGQALPPSDDLFRRAVYVVGDGERMQSGRPGADDHLQYKSKGDSV